MARKHAAPEPLLIAAARRLGKAAGTVVNMTQLLTPEPTPASHSASEPESIKEASHDKQSAATARKNQPKQKPSAIAKKGTAKSRKATARTITSKRRSSRKR
jgi:hypothetical protein